MAAGILRAAVRQINPTFIAASAVIYVIAFVVAWQLGRGGGQLLQRANVAERGWRRALVALALVYFAAYAYLSVQRYNKLLCSTYDLAIFDSLYYNALGGKLFTDYRGPFDHFEPLYLALVPFYALWRDARLLLVLQSAIFSLAAWPLYLAAAEVSGRKTVGAAVAILYLLYPLVGEANLYDYHTMSLSPLCFFTMLYFMVKKNWRWYWVSLALVLLVKESEAILVFGAGLYLLSKKEYAKGAITSALAVAWFFSATTLVLPAVTGRSFRQFGRYGGLDVVFERVVSSPGGYYEALGYGAKTLSVMLFTLAPLGFLCARRWRALVFVYGPTFAVHMTSRVFFQNVIFGHYAITMASAALGAAALAVDAPKGFSEDERPSALPVFLVIVAVLSNLAFSFPANERYIYAKVNLEMKRSWNLLSLPLPMTAERRDFYRTTPRERLFFAVRDAVPRGSSVAELSRFTVYFANGYKVRAARLGASPDYYLFDLKTTPESVWPVRNEYPFEAPHTASGDTVGDKSALYEPFAKSPDYVRLVDLTTPEHGGFLFFAKKDKWQAVHDNLLAAEERDPADEGVRLALAAVERTAERRKAP